MGRGNRPCTKPAIMSFDPEGIALLTKVPNANPIPDPSDHPVLAYGSAGSPALTYRAFLQKNLKWLFPLQVIHILIVLAGVALVVAASFDIVGPPRPALSKLAPLQKGAFYWDDLDLMVWACAVVSLFGIFATYRARRTQSHNTGLLRAYALSAPLLFALDLAAEIILVLASPIALVATPLTGTSQIHLLEFDDIAGPVMLLLPGFILLILWFIARYKMKLPLK